MTVRIGLVEWVLSSARDLQALLREVEHGVTQLAPAVDFILYPEYFSLSLLNVDWPIHKGLVEVARLTADIVSHICFLSKKHGVHIIAGSMPTIGHEVLFNVSYLCRPDGTFHSYAKVHVTPFERQYWNIHAGDAPGIFFTDFGAVGIQICYDIEFPEWCRIYAEYGVKILFVPFMTEDKTAYSRVSRCAAARAVENECYVAMTGLQGGLDVPDLSGHHGHPRIYTPLDHTFPASGITPDESPASLRHYEGSIDLGLLSHLHRNGSATTLSDRRDDIYSITKSKIQDD